MSSHCEYSELFEPFLDACLELAKRALGPLTYQLDLIWRRIQNVFPQYWSHLPRFSQQWNQRIKGWEPTDTSKCHSAARRKCLRLAILAKWNHVSCDSSKVKSCTFRFEQSEIMHLVIRTTWHHARFGSNKVKSCTFRFDQYEIMHLVIGPKWNHVSCDSSTATSFTIWFGTSNRTVNSPQSQAMFPMHRVAWLDLCVCGLSISLCATDRARHRRASRHRRGCQTSEWPLTVASHARMQWMCDGCPFIGQFNHWQTVNWFEIAVSSLILDWFIVRRRSQITPDAHKDIRSFVKWNLQELCLLRQYRDVTLAETNSCELLIKRLAGRVEARFLFEPSSISILDETCLSSNWSDHLYAIVSEHAIELSFSLRAITINRFLSTDFSFWFSRINYTKNRTLQPQIDRRRESHLNRLLLTISKYSYFKCVRFK
jgi:hypothetical protein